MLQRLAGSERCRGEFLLRPRGEVPQHRGAPLDRRGADVRQLPVVLVAPRPHPRARRRVEVPLDEFVGEALPRRRRDRRRVLLRKGAVTAHQPTGGGQNGCNPNGRGPVHPDCRRVHRRTLISAVEEYLNSCAVSQPVRIVSQIPPKANLHAGLGGLGWTLGSGCVANPAVLSGRLRSTLPRRPRTDRLRRSGVVLDSSDSSRATLRCGTISFVEGVGSSGYAPSSLTLSKSSFTVVPSHFRRHRQFRPGRVPGRARTVDD